MRADIPRLMLVGPGSGSGKTTLTCALLLALKRRGLNPAAFKCGPDYIDPLFHTTVLGVESCTLDMVLCGEDAVPFLLARYAQGHDLAVIEGVMGLYDGQGVSDYGSSNHIAMGTHTPEVLVLSPRGQSLSLAAQVSGYLNFAPNAIAGVIFNQCAPGLYPFYRDMLEDRLGLKAYGYLPSLPEAAFDSRHLGLVTPDAIPGVHAKLELLAQACEASVDLEGLLGLAQAAGGLDYQEMRQQPIAQVTIAVARDNAFCFHYRDSLEVLRELGASLAFFSPLTDAELPQGASGLLLGGGYPEEHAAMLSANRALREHICRLAAAGLPIFAECGGFMYLGRSLRDRQGTAHAMVGAIDAEAFMTGRLGRFGYITLRAEKDTFLGPRGSEYRAHEFHYSDTDDNGQACIARKANGKSWPCVHASGPEDATRIFAGYPHVHFRGNPELAATFVAACGQYAEQRQ